jgi:two-component system, NtrC family, sensor kinase
MQHATAIEMQTQKFDAVTQLAAGVAHEINTPVQYIGDNLLFLKDAFSEMIAALRATKRSPGMLRELMQARERFDFGYLEAEIPQAIEQALEGVSRVAKVVRAMQEFSPSGTERKVPINLNHAIESTLLVAGNEWKYVADMRLDLEPFLPLVCCHPGEIQQVVYSLIVHAAHAFESSAQEDSGLGLITVRTRSLTGWVELCIENTGAAEAQPRIMDPSVARKAFKDAVQGLAMACSVVVEKHQGTLDFQTEEEQGRRFTLRLPCSRAQEAGGGSLPA